MGSTTDIQTPSGPRIFSVSQLNGRIREILEGDLGPVWVEAEVGHLARPVSGHLYLTLKDEASQLRAVLFKNKARYLGFQPETGMQVLVFGQLTVYQPRGEYQLIVDHIEPLGAGALAVAFEQLKAKLAAEGLFDPDRKQPLPGRPERVVVITSPTGAAVVDFLRVVRRARSRPRITILPVRVQGDEAPAMIAAAIEQAAELDPAPDLIVLTRGGGSPQDLAAFNSEVVARAEAACPRPLISAVGHEIDLTIADLAADIRAATPTAAAELIIRPFEEATGRLSELEARLPHAARAALLAAGQRLNRASARLAAPRRLIIQARLTTDGLTERLTHRLRLDLARRQHRLAELTARIGAAHPRAKLGRATDRHGRLTRRLARALKTDLTARRTALARAATRLQDLSPLNILGRGYSIALDDQRRPVTDAALVEIGQRLEVVLNQGRLDCRVDKITPPGEDGR